MIISNETACPSSPALYVPREYLSRPNIDGTAPDSKGVHVFCAHGKQKKKKETGSGPDHNVLAK
jgi:hypothetical protein